MMSTIMSYDLWLVMSYVISFIFVTYNFVGPTVRYYYAGIKIPTCGNI